MFTEKQLHRYADILLWGLTQARSKPFKKEDIVMVHYDAAAIRLAEILYKKLLASGRHPIVRGGATPFMEQVFFETASHKQLKFQAPGEKELLNHLNGSISLLAPASLTHLSDVDPKKIGQVAAARKPLRDLLDKRETQGAFSWTLAMYPTGAMAKHAGLSLDEYARQIAAACFLNRTEPLTHWKTVFKKANRIKHWLNRMVIKTLHIESKSTDIKIAPGDNRRWLGVSGHNIPSFEIFLSPDWRQTDGVYLANMPAYRSGNYIRNLRIEFKQGKAVSIAADEGETFAKKILATDDGAKKLGEFSLTDKRFSKINRFMANTLFDENFGGKQGNCHIALGASYADTYAGDAAKLTKTRKKQLGFNDSAIHWDIINTEKKRVTAILADGKRKTIYENGKFTC